MPTLQSGGSPGTRIEVGNVVLGAAEAVDLKPVAARFAAFQKVHADYVAAEAGAQKAADALKAQQEKVAEADVDQDAALDGLAGALAGDGLPRANPFKPFGAPGPAALKGKGYAVEAKEVLALEKAVLKSKTLSQRTKDAAHAAGAAAKKVQAALKPIEKLENARASALAKRNALEQAWETGFAALKRAAKAAADDGHPGLFGALFERTAAPRKRAPSKKKGAEDAAPTG